MAPRIICRRVERIRDARPDMAMTHRISLSAFPASAMKILQRRMRLVRDIVKFAQCLFLQIQPAPRHARCRPCASRFPKDVKAERLDALQKLLLSQQDDANRRFGRSARACRCCSKSGAATSGQFDRPHALSAAGSCDGRCLADRPASRRCADRSACTANSLKGVLEDVFA